MGTGDLASLISERKGDRSYRRLERDAGGVPTSGRWQQLAENPIRTFPKPDTVYGISRALGVTVTEVVMAAARSLGVQVREDSAGSLSTEGLSDEHVDVVRRVIAALSDKRSGATRSGAPMTTEEPAEPGAVIKSRTPEGKARVQVTRQRKPDIDLTEEEGKGKRRTRPSG